MKRREFLRLSTALAAVGVVGSSVWQEALAALAMTGPGPYGELGAPDANGIRLPAGFRARVLARAMEPVAGRFGVWHIFPDGGATFRAPGGWVYVSNSEFVSTADPPAGAGALRFDHEGQVVAAFRILTGTNFNCAGGATPWGTWLSCEELPGGFVWECDPLGQVPPVRRDALGQFQHEAVAVDPEERRLYLTEDVGDGRFYRFTPEVWGDLSGGLLEVARVDAAGAVSWVQVPEPVPSSILNFPTRLQVSDSTPFDGGEGIVWDRGRVFFTTKGDDRVWDYEPASQTLRVLYDRAADSVGLLNGVDNITAAGPGDLFVAEDHGGGEQELVLISPNGTVSAFLQLTGAEHESSEITGPAFDPWGRRLYLSSQRGGPDGAGVTYEVTGPFRQFVGGGGTCASPTGSGS